MGEDGGVMKRKSPEGSKYPDNWKEISDAVKEAAGWKCVRCGHKHERESGHVLTVHHLDINPSHCQWWNVPALCQKCHLIIQHKVVIEQPYFFSHSEWFKPYVAAYYGVVEGIFPSTFDYFESLKLVSRETVAARMDELLALGLKITIISDADHFEVA
jgi:hypothetical protein